MAVFCKPVTYRQLTFRISNGPVFGKDVFSCYTHNI